MSNRAAVAEALARFPRVTAVHAPTPIEALPRLGAKYGLELSVKRDDCTGVAFGGNKVRQLEFYIGAAQAKGADTLLITSAVQSNFMRTAAAMGRQYGMDCHIQLEDRVPDTSSLYRSNGNVLLDNVSRPDFEVSRSGPSHRDGEQQKQEQRYSTHPDCCVFWSFFDHCSRFTLKEALEDAAHPEGHQQKNQC